ncbi:hypothetical protein FPHYL_13592 [Fusarium phyllophilum]|uniref:Uncharacterized protein n=1 Tax=Fusarium phyllophilum TaxID=47803 RepID=A0A8H5IAR9_9HYPO|nr:hypothetical protein FPHYL_13592 [Fusarium phyllophilum]
MSRENIQEPLAGDLRRAYNIHSDNNDEVALILETRHPLAANKTHSTGLQCLTAVLRRINSHVMLGPEGLANTQHFQSAEAENPIIRFSWLMFGRDPSELEMRHRDWMSTKKELVNRGLKVSETFETLCTSRMMNQSYWSQDEMRLLAPKMCLETWQVVNEDTEEIASAGLVTLDRARSPDMTLQQAVESSFGMFRREGKRTLHRPARPYIIRVLYNPGPSPRLSFRHLRGFNLPIWRETQDRQNPFDTSERAPYVLLAVVRMRCSPEADDFVRFYAAIGTEIVPQYEDIPCVDTNWSVEDENSNRYMLFYGPPAHDTSLNVASDSPETERRSVKDDDNERAIRALFSRGMKPYIEKAVADQAAALAAQASQRAETAEPGEVLEDPPRRTTPYAPGPSHQGRGGAQPPGQRGNPKGRTRDPSNGQGSGRRAKKPRYDAEVNKDVNRIPLGRPQMPDRNKDQNRD